MDEQNGARKEEQAGVKSGRSTELDRREAIKTVLGAGIIAAVGAGLGGTAKAQQPIDFNTMLSRAVLKEIPLGQLELYLQVLNSGVAANRDVASSKGDWCGGGCNNPRGDACGIFCIVGQPSSLVGAFDVFGHSGLTKEALQNALANPQRFRAALTTELGQLTSFVEDPKFGPSLAPTINPATFDRLVQECP